LALLENMHWLKLIRSANLLIIFLTQFFAWACVILPMQEFDEVPFLLNFRNFFTLSISTILIAAAGYIINDYFDIRIDNINRPEKLVLEKKIPRRLGIIMHAVLNIIGLFLAGVLAWKSGHPGFVAIQLGSVLMLWFYSTHFKRKFMIGNVFVSLLTGFTIIVLILYEPALHYYLKQPPFLKHLAVGVLPNPVWILGMYCYFAFVLTWMREIVKDMEDYKGDMAEGCVTMPIKWGFRKTIIFTQALGILVIGPLLIVGVRLLNAGDILLGLYSLLGLVFPLTYWHFYLQKKITTKHFGKASRWLKIIMVLGIGSLIIYYFEANA